MKNAIAYIDGGSRGNPGDAAIGVWFSVYDTETKTTTVTEHHKYIGVTTNNVAEYGALLQAVILARKEGIVNLFVYSDSMLIVNQIKGLFQIKQDSLRKMYDEIIKELVHIKAFHIEYVPREKNKDADRLVNVALDKKQGKKK